MSDHCLTCGRPTQRAKRRCKICSNGMPGGNDDDPPGPEIGPSPSEPTMNLTPTAAPAHRTGPRGATA